MLDVLLDEGPTAGQIAFLLIKDPVVVEERRQDVQLRFGAMNNLHFIFPVERSARLTTSIDTTFVQSTSKHHVHHEHGDHTGRQYHPADELK